MRLWTLYIVFGIPRGASKVIDVNIDVASSTCTTVLVGAQYNFRFPLTNSVAGKFSCRLAPNPTVKTGRRVKRRTRHTISMRVWRVRVRVEKKNHKTKNNKAENGNEEARQEDIVMGTGRVYLFHFSFYN